MTEDTLYQNISNFINHHQNLKPRINIIFCYENHKNILLNFDGFSMDMLKTMKKNDIIHIYKHMEINLSFEEKPIKKNYKLDI